MQRDVLFRIDSTIQFADENYHEFMEGVRRSPRQYPCKDNRPEDLFNEFKNLILATSAQLSDYTLAHFKMWLRNGKFETSTKPRSAQRSNSSEIKPEDDREKNIQARMQKLQAVQKERAEQTQKLAELGAGIKSEDESAKDNSEESEEFAL